MRSEGSPLKDHVSKLVVATNETTQLPQDWQWSGAEHRRYTREEIEEWRQLARKEVAKEKPMEMARKDFMGSGMGLNYSFRRVQAQLN